MPTLVEARLWPGNGPDPYFDLFPWMGQEETDLTGGSSSMGSLDTLGGPPDLTTVSFATLTGENLRFSQDLAHRLPSSCQPESCSLRAPARFDADGRTG
jgi:hypothetical protein